MTQRKPDRSRWNSIAEDLGIESTPAPVAPAAREKPEEPTPPPPAPEPIVETPSRQLRHEPEVIEHPAVEAEESASVSFEVVRENIEATIAEVRGENPLPEEGEEPRRGRRRRRRGRGEKPEVAEGATEPVTGQGVPVEESEEDEEGEAATVGEETKGAEEDADGKRRRRRRRRRKGAVGSEGPVAAPRGVVVAEEGEEAEEAEEGEEAEAEEVIAEEGGVASALEADDVEIEDLSNLNVPSWAELIASLYRPER